MTFFCLLLSIVFYLLVFLMRKKWYDIRLPIANFILAFFEVSTTFDYVFYQYLSFLSKFDCNKVKLCKIVFISPSWPFFCLLRLCMSLLNFRKLCKQFFLSFWLLQRKKINYKIWILATFMKWPFHGLFAAFLALW